ncbi:uncharacterized membrane protein YraQ (UPF0718 family) [Pullulanibacillus pueri]|uniref:Permease n=1 Tax=Pullulanibacillus pueri TaxID=1437324 RepID=A0A8J3EMR0_9BACL|nr:permease [Pullulanibacillus pueri]MBM7682872.1 uncharacterized membrane protein YraQ (UPF0718 family) [Pullulanibacillus pueri]GGH84347.1 hypothetical protein GCM10007096_27210 [Pullulanibacillus pueri]
MNGQTKLASESPLKARKSFIVGGVIFIVVALIGLYWAKWNPYFHKAFIAAHDHAIGSSSISGEKVSAPAPSWHAAWDFTVNYFNSIWKAYLVAIILASLVQVALPKDWIRRVLGKTTYGSTVIAGLSALPGMMCTCCTAPLVVGMRKQSSSVSAAVAFWFGNTALNPAVLVFMFFVLGWKFTLLRLIFGVVLVFGISYLAGRFARKDTNVTEMIDKVEESFQKPKGNLAFRWLKSLGAILIATVPAYVLSVIVLGAFRAWLFPEAGIEWGNSLFLILLFAIVGTLFVIPTSGEIPIIQTFMNFGLSSGPAAVLAIVLPVISLPSALMVRKALSWRVLGFLGLSVAILGIIAGLIGSLIGV